MRVVVCDDEILAVERLVRMLSRIDDVVIEGTAQNGRDALTLIDQHAPDALFLDIEMPALDGFDVVEALAADAKATPPLIVFVTAYPQFAAHAFDTGAIDFLIKPVRHARLETGVARLRDVLEQRDARRRLAELASQLNALRAEGGNGGAAANEIWVHRRAERVRVDLDTVEMVQAEGEYVRLFIDGGDYLHRESLVALLAQLDPDRYLRIHRSSVVDADAIVGVRRRATGSYQAIMRDGTVLAVGRSYRGVVRKLTNRAS